jgi:hypothetical protein
VHRHDLLREAVVVAGLAAEVQLADRDDAMPRVAQPVMPARDRAVVAVGVVPVADLVVVAADRERGARRHADRAGRVRRGEARAARGERVEVRRGDERMARGAEELRVVLVGHQDEQVGRRDRRVIGMAIQLEARLFERTGRGARLTPAGRRLLPRAEALTAEVDRLPEIVADDAARLAGVVRLAVQPSASWPLVGDLVAIARRRHPNVRLQIAEGPHAPDRGEPRGWPGRPRGGVAAAASGAR